MSIPTEIYFRRFKLRGIVPISSHWKEERSGYQAEETHDVVAALENGIPKQFEASCYQNFAPNSGPPDYSISAIKVLSPEEYNSLKLQHGTLDTPEFVVALENRQQLQKEYENTLPKCPKCGTSMIERSSAYGRFFGCSNFPHCDGKRKVTDKLREKLSRIQADLRKCGSL